MQEMTRKELLKRIMGMMPPGIKKGDVQQVFEALDTVLHDAIMRDEAFKIRITDMLYIVIKRHAGGKYRDFMSHQVLSRPASWVAAVARTPRMVRSLKQRGMQSTPVEPAEVA